MEPLISGGPQWRRHGVDWGGHVHPSFPRGRFSNLSKSVEKNFGGGGVIFCQFTLFSKSTEVELWKKEYGDHLKEKERAEKDKAIQIPKTWLCIPTLLKIFAKNGLSNLFPDFFEVVKIIASNSSILRKSTQ